MIIMMYVCIYIYIRRHVGYFRSSFQLFCKILNMFWVKPTEGTTMEPLTLNSKP